MGKEVLDKILEQHGLINHYTKTFHIGTAKNLSYCGLSEYKPNHIYPSNIEPIEYGIDRYDKFFHSESKRFVSI